MKPSFPLFTLHFNFVFDIIEINSIHNYLCPGIVVVVQFCFALKSVLGLQWGTHSPPNIGAPVSRPELPKLLVKGHFHLVMTEISMGQAILSPRSKRDHVLQSQVRTQACRSSMWLSFARYEVSAHGALKLGGGTQRRLSLGPGSWSSRHHLRNGWVAMNRDSPTPKTPTIDGCKARKFLNKISWPSASRSRNGWLCNIHGRSTTSYLSINLFPLEPYSSALQAISRSFTEHRYSTTGVGAKLTHGAHEHQAAHHSVVAGLSSPSSRTTSLTSHP